MKIYGYILEGTFREAASGLLQLGFGLYQLVSQDAHFSVARDGLASPFLLVLPYLGMAAINTTINIIDPPYTVVTVLDISQAARHEFICRRNSSFSSPTRSSTGYFLPQDTMADRNFRLRLPDRVQPTSDGQVSPELLVNTTYAERLASPPIVQSPTTIPTSPSFSPRGLDQNGDWDDFTRWLKFAYGERIDVYPVDRLYQTPWISQEPYSSGEFIYTTGVGLLIPFGPLSGG